MARPELLTSADLPVSFGRFELLCILGEGGMARVFRARMTGPSGFRKQIALKVIHRVVSDRGEGLRRALTAEARLGGMLHHPNVVDTYDFGEEEGQPWIALELVDGLTLGDLLARVGRVPPSLAVEIGLQICAGLEHAHTLEDEGRLAGLVHRDLKPSNIILSRQGLAKVMDFGIAKAGHISGETTATGMTKGTPAFMSPEQMEGAELDARSDLFAFGALFYELLTGRRLFDAETVMAVMMSVFRVDQMLEETRKLEVLDDLHPDLRAVVASCLDKDPAARPASARQVITALRRIATRFDRGLRLDEYVEAALAGRAPRLEPLVSGKLPRLAPTPPRAQASAPVPPAAPEPRPERPSREVGPTVAAPVVRTSGSRSSLPLLVLAVGALMMAVGLALVVVLVRGGRGEPTGEVSSTSVPDLPVDSPLAPTPTATRAAHRPTTRPAPGPAPTPTAEPAVGGSPLRVDGPGRVRVGEKAAFRVTTGHFAADSVALRFRPQGGAWQSRAMRRTGGAWLAELDLRPGMEGTGAYWVLAKHSSGARATLGSREDPLALEVVPSDAPEPVEPPAPLKLSPDRPVQSATAGEPRTFMVRLRGDGDVSVSLRFRPQGGSWQSRVMERGPAGRWSVDLDILESWRGAGAYYFYARAADGRTAKLGSREEPFPVEIR